MLDCDYEIVFILKAAFHSSTYSACQKSLEDFGYVLTVRSSNHTAIRFKHPLTPEKMLTCKVIAPELHQSRNWHLHFSIIEQRYF